ncbi:MAG: addiction module component, family protein [Candidatus Methylumidiphilus alinenensis]|uniref:Addiction module component, family protein n=1 Tax=Candidatus Methylumidiphilus alinenensis TaxID=2202197 RepID=A0A2W4SP95_9GAMM|nr:MAG: addiction module component, family protein [Candidatus Methylumidiphilus alinenensis]
MVISVTQLFAEASSLDEGDRAALAGLLLESLDQPPSPGIEAAWAEEIERRLRELDTGQVDLIPWEEVKNRLLVQEQSRH